MAQWTYKVDLRSDWNEARNGAIDAHELGQRIAKQLQALPCFTDDVELQIITEEFENLPEDANFDDFDIAYDALCDWGDSGNLCWINTFR